MKESNKITFSYNSSQSLPLAATCSRPLNQFSGLRPKERQVDHPQFKDYTQAECLHSWYAGNYKLPLAGFRRFRPTLSILRAAFILAVAFLFACQPEPGSLQPGDPLFTLLSSKKTGIDFINRVEDQEDFNVFTYRNYYNGGGVAIGDINGDNLPDVYLTANMGPNKLYLNKGNLQFEDITELAGVAGTKSWSTGVAMVDINADGLLDIYVCNSGDVEGANKENELFVNVSKGDQIQFQEQAATYGLNDPGFSTHASFFDYDQDGDLDCYVLNNSFKDPRRMRLDQTKRDQMDPMGGDKLFRNENGTFTNVTAEAGIFGSADGFGLGVSVSDINGDRLPDIYISNDFWERDYLYINQGDGTFTEELTDRLGLSSASSMGADIGDLDNDGDPEIFTTDMLPGDNFRLKTMTMFDPFLFDQLNFRETYYYQMMQNCLQVNEGNGQFQERAHLSGVAATDWSWGSLMLDFDNDGMRDILVCNGIYHNITDMDFVDFVSDQDNIRQIVQNKGKLDVRELIKELKSTPLANYAFKNKGGLHFDNQAFELGLGTPGFSNGAAYGDLDGDGDLDLVMNNLNSEAWVYQNQTIEKDLNHFLNVAFKGNPANPFGIGAMVEIRLGEQQQSAQHYLSRGFESSVAPGLLFGVGERTTIDQLTVYWSDGRRQVLQNLPVDQTVTLSYSEATPFTPNSSNPPKPWFEETTVQQLQGDIRHRENNFNDFNHEPLLWRMLSTEGPRIVKGDANGDGLEDFVLLGAADQADKLFLQSENGQFQEQSKTGLEQGQDQESTCGLFVDVDQDGDQDLLIGSGGNEFDKGPGNFRLRYYENRGDGRFLRLDYKVPAATGNFSTIIATDIDDDKDVDLFIGSRAVPGNYGLIPRNFLFRNDGNGIWTDITTQVVGTMGLVTDAAWADVNRDGAPDLIAVGEWMPVTIAPNEDGKFEKAFPLPGTYGWWTRIQATDMNGDDRKDLVLGNWGLNSKFQPTEELPLKLWVKDFDQNKKSEFVLTWRPPLETQNFPFADKKTIGKQMPHLLKRFLSYEAYAVQLYPTLFGEAERQGANELEAGKLASGIYWNLDSVFQWQAFPDAAQVAPVMAICTEDLDEDGIRDIWLGGNFYGLQPQVGHLSANHGVFLKGDGQGGFEFVSPQQTGIYLKGEMRDAQLVEGPNGKKTFIVARNDAELKAYQKEH